MSALIQSLRNMEQAVESLEDSIGGMEKRLSGSQRDMFGGPDVRLDAKGMPVASGIQPPSEVKIMAKRLDFAIMKVEELLEENA